MKIKFLSLNMLHGGVYFDKIADFIKKQNPDILTLQEVNNGTKKDLPKNLRSIQELQKLLPSFDYKFSKELAYIWPEGQVDMGNAIFSRFKINKAHTTFLHSHYQVYKQDPSQTDFSHEPCNMLGATIKADSTSLNVYSLHGVWGFDGKDNPERLKMGHIIINEIKKQKNVILAGDFNLQPSTKTIKNIESHLNNVFQGELTSTFNMKRKTNPGYATAVVDMIFTSNNIQTLSKSCPRVDISDHLPLVGTFQIPSN